MKKELTKFDGAPSSYEWNLQMCTKTNHDSQFIWVKSWNVPVLLTPVSVATNTASQLFSDNLKSLRNTFAHVPLEHWLPCLATNQNISNLSQQHDCYKLLSLSNYLHPPSNLGLLFFFHAFLTYCLTLYYVI